MPFQSTVRNDMAGGVVGDLYLDGPIRAQTGVLKTADAANNVVGRALTHVAGQDGQFVAGGTGAFAGILTGRHQYALQTAGLAPSMQVPNDLQCEAMTMCSGIILQLTGDVAGNIGDAIAYTATGEIVPAPGGTAPSGATLIANSKIVRQNVPANGLAIVELTD